MPSPEPDALDLLPLSDVLQGFLAAQKLDLRESRQTAPGCTVIQTDDDNNLVNTYVAYEPVPGGDPLDLGDVLGRSATEASRTDLVVPDSLNDRISELTSEVRGHARRVVPLSDFFDGFLRPQGICRELLGEQKAKAPDRERLDANDITAEDLLLSEDNFIDDQYAVGPGRGRFHAFNYLYTDWVRGASPRVCILVAPPGFGKTKITHILAKRMARQYSQSTAGARPPLPILIAFGRYRRGASSFSSLVLEALNRIGSNLLTFDGFCYLIGFGRVRFILDGYDEMIDASPDIARDNFRDFMWRAGPQSRILLTARSNYYRTSLDLMWQVGDPLLSEAEVEVVELLPFNLSQAKRYIDQRMGKIGRMPSILTERAQQVLEIGDNLEVLGIPFFLAEFVNLVAVEALSISDARRLGILEYLIQLTFDRERVRQHHAFTDEQQRRFLEAIAFDLLVTGEVGYSRADLEIFAAEVASEEQLRQPNWPSQWNGLANHYFLVPVDDDVGQPRVTLRHRVWRDYFQGSAIAARLHVGDRERDRALAFLAAHDLPDGVLRSAAAHLSAAARRALLARLSDSGDTLLRNMLRMELPQWEPEGDDMLVLPSEISAQLPGRDLSGTVFTRVRFDGSLANANLTDCLFEHCDLTSTVFDGAVLNRTALSACRFSDTLASANTASVTIDDEVLFGPQLAARFAGHGARQQAVSGPDKFGEWVIEVVRDRLAKFLKPSGSGAHASFRPVITWTAFMSGVDPKHHDFVLRRVYRALRAERIIGEGPRTLGSRRFVRITADPAVRAEVLAFVRRGQVGPSIERVVRRLVA